MYDVLMSTPSKTNTRRRDLTTTETICTAIEAMINVIADDTNPIVVELAEELHAHRIRARILRTCIIPRRSEDAAYTEALRTAGDALHLAECIERESDPAYAAECAAEVEAEWQTEAAAHRDRELAYELRYGWDD